MAAPVPAASEAGFLWSLSQGCMEVSSARELLLSAGQQHVGMLADYFWPLIINAILFYTFQRLNLCIGSFFIH